MSELLRKIDVSDIIISHINSIKDQNTGKFAFGEILLFAIIPIAVSILVGSLGSASLSSESLKYLIPTVAILMAFLLNGSALLINVAKNENKHKNADRYAIRNKAIKEGYANISFSILIAFLTLLLLLLLLIENDILKSIVNYVLFFLFTEFFVNLIMIISRMHILFKAELRMFEENQDKP